MRYHVGLCISFVWLLACKDSSAGQPAPSRPTPPPVEQAPAPTLEAPAPLRGDAVPEQAKRLRGEASRLRRAGQISAARSLLEQACAMEDAPSCLRLAELLEAGEGGAADLERSRELFEMACASGSREACDALGH